MQNYSGVISMIAIALFAITGVLAGMRKGADIFSLLVFGLVTALGGGTIRDMILNIPVFWTDNVQYIWVAAGAAVIAFFIYHLLAHAQRLLLYLDAVGVALFTIQAIDKTLNLGHRPLIAIIMGVITGIGGGLVRDVLTDRPTLLMTKELYATPILSGSVVYILMIYLAPRFPFSWLVAMVVIFVFRAAAIHWDLSMPGLLTAKRDINI